MEAPNRQLPEPDDDHDVPVVSFIGLRRPEPVPVSSFPAASVREAPVPRSSASKNPMEEDIQKAKKASGAQTSEVPMDDATLKTKLEDFNANYHSKKYNHLQQKLEASRLNQNRAKDQSKPPNKEDRQRDGSRSAKANIIDDETEIQHPLMSTNPQVYSQTLTQFVVVLVAVFVMMYPAAFLTALMGISAGYAIRHFDLFTHAGMTKFIAQFAHIQPAQSRIPVVVSAPDDSENYFEIRPPEDYDSPLKPSVSTQRHKDSTEDDGLAARAVINDFFEEGELSVPERIHLMRMFKQSGLNTEVGMTVDEMYDLPEDGSGFPMTVNKIDEDVRVVFARSETDTALVAAIQSGVDLMGISPDEFVRECYAGSVDATVARILSPIKNPADAVTAEQINAMNPLTDDGPAINVEAAMAEHIKRISKGDSFARAVEAVRSDEDILEVQRMSQKTNTLAVKPHLKINTRSAPKERVRAANIVGSNTEILNAHNITHRIASLYSSRANPFLNNAMEVHLVSGNYKSSLDIIEAHCLDDVGSTVSHIIESAKRLVAKTQANIKAMSLRSAALKAASTPAADPVAPAAEVKTSN